MVAIAAAMLAGGCRTDNGDAIQLPVDGGIKFGAAVHEISAAQTRTLVANDITHEYGDVDFFIQLDYAKSGEATTKSTIKRYTVASSYAGRLDAKFSDNSLIWQDASSNHTFYAWTLPWMESAAEGNSGYADEAEDAESCLKNYYHEDGKPKIVVEFHDSGDGKDFETYQNNAIFEKFIGAQIGPYYYKKQGNYVPLTFYHLVSQVFLNKLTVIRGDGSRHEDLKGDLTFIGMPKTAVFDPHPATLPDGTSPHPAEWITYPDEAWNTHPHHPVVMPKDRYDPDSELTFFISEPKEDDRLLHRFFICPEVDFSKLAYKVKITTEGADEFGIEYYGDFSKVKFRRVKGNDYDKGTNTGDNSSAEDDTVLHAGEMMTLNITLHPGVGPGATIVIQDWSDPQPTESSHYAHPGIFTDHAAQELADAEEKDMEELFNLYGETTDEGEKVFKIYENVTVTGNNFPALGDYIIDGMGHTITMGSSPVTVGAMRDVYLTDGTNIVYIDDKGVVFTVDPKTYTTTRTGQLEKGKSSTIDLTTGKVSPA